MPENKVFSHLAVLRADNFQVMSCPSKHVFDLTGRELMLRIWQLHKGELHSSVANLTLGFVGWCWVGWLGWG